MAEKYVFQAILEDKEILASLKRIESHFDRLAKNGGRSFDNIDKGAKLSGVQIGVIGGVVAGLTNKFVELGQAAVRTLTDIAASSVNAAGELEVTGKVFTGVFQGDAKAADAALERLRETSRELGIDLTDLGKAFLPEVGSLAELERVSKLAAGLALAQPEQGAAGVRVALQEALSGNLLSLQRRFELSPEAIGRIKELQKELGNVPGLLQGLEAELKRTGRDVETLADTFQGATGRMQQQGLRLQQALGAPIVEELKEQFDDLGAILEERGVDFEEIAGRVGELVANVAEFVGGNLADFLANLDEEQVKNIFDTFNNVLDTTFDLVEAMGLLELPQKFLDGLETTVEGLDKALQKAFDLNAQFQIAAARDRAEAEVRRRFAEEQGADLSFSRGRLFAGIVGGEGRADVQEQARLAGEKAAAEEEAKIEAIRQQTEKDRADREAKRAARGVRGKGDAAAADAFLREQQAAREAAAALEEYTAAKKKADEASAKLELDLEREASRLDIDASRKRLDALADFADKRVDQATKALQRIQDIEKDNARSIEDIDRAAARRVSDAEKERAQKRLDIEKEYQRTLADIRQRSFYDLEEASQRRDAVAYLRILRDQQQQIQESATTRDRDLEDARTAATLKREELKVQLEREKEDAAIALQRKYDDARIAEGRELEAIKVNEQRKLAEIDLWEQRRRDDLNASYQQKLTDLQTSLAAELEIIRNYEQQKTEAVLSEAARREEVARQANTSRRSLDRSQQDRISRQVAQGRTVLAGRQAGGPVAGGGSYLVGERGPEIFTPALPGHITPSPLMMNTIPSTNIMNSISNDRILNNQMGIVDPSSLDAIITAKLENLLVGFLGRM